MRPDLFQLFCVHLRVKKEDELMSQKTASLTFEALARFRMLFLFRTESMTATFPGRARTRIRAIKRNRAVSCWNSYLMVSAFRAITESSASAMSASSERYRMCGVGRPWTAGLWKKAAPKSFGARVCVRIPTRQLKKRLFVAVPTDKSNRFHFNLPLLKAVIGWGGENGSFPDN